MEAKISEERKIDSESTSEPKMGLPRRDDAMLIDILKTEYSSSLNLYTHTENALTNIFNFYLTLLTAFIGGIILLAQNISANINFALFGITILLVMVILIGIIIQDALVNKNIDLAKYAIALNLLKLRLFKDWPNEKRNIIYFHNFWAKVDPLAYEDKSVSSRVHRRWWWAFPLGTHQLFIGVINNSAFAALLIILTYLLSGEFLTSRSWIVLIVTLLLTFLINQFYAQKKFRDAATNFVTSDGKKVDWAMEPLDNTLASLTAVLEENEESKEKLST